MDPTTYGDATYTLKLDQNGAFSELKASGQGHTISFNANDGFKTWNGGYLVSTSASGYDAATAGVKITGITADTTRFAWNYQTFGVWQTSFSDISAAQVRGGAMTVGAVTPANAVPTTGIVDFWGFTSAFFAGSVEGPLETGLGIRVDFASRAAEVQSGSFIGVNNGRVYNGANFKGTMTYTAGSNTLTGPIHNLEGTMSGTITGRFYGPGADEVGGLFSMQGQAEVNGLPALQLSGAYGSRRTPIPAGWFTP